MEKNKGGGGTLLFLPLRIAVNVISWKFMILFKQLITLASNLDSFFDFFGKIPI